MGSMRTCAKLDLVDCLEDLAAVDPSGDTPAVQAVIIDSAELFAFLAQIVTNSSLITD